MKEGSAAFNAAAIELALQYVELAACKACGHPVRVGFCCISCGSGAGSSDDHVIEVNYKALES